MQQVRRCSRCVGASAGRQVCRWVWAGCQMCRRVAGRCPGGGAPGALLRRARRVRARTLVRAGAWRSGCHCASPPAWTLWRVSRCDGCGVGWCSAAALPPTAAARGTHNHLNHLRAVRCGSSNQVAHTRTHTHTRAHSLHAQGSPVPVAVRVHVHTHTQGRTHATCRLRCPI